MEYSNPKIPEEINYSKENHLKEFFYLAIGIFLVIAIFVGSVHLFAQNFAHHIPFKYEEKMMPDSLESILGKAIKSKDQDNELHQKKQQYLATLANQLANNMNLPDDMHINIHYINTDTVNAGATLNGQILIYQGLLDFVESENELAMVIAHEIAHIKARHPIKALSSGIIVSLAMSIVSGSIDNGGAVSALTSGSVLTSLSFSRKQENQADEMALAALHAYYGHTQGSSDFFARLAKEEKLGRYLHFISTHPKSVDRINNLNDMAATYKQNHNINKVPLKAFLKTQ